MRCGNSNAPSANYADNSALCLTSDRASLFYKHILIAECACAYPHTDQLPTRLIPLSGISRR
jgi:hypothetical protein